MYVPLSIHIISLFLSTFFYVLHVFFFLFLLCWQKGDFSGKINDKGCLPAGEKWLEQNLISIAGVAVGIAFLQVGPFHCSVLPTLFQFPFLLVKYNSTFHIFFPDPWHMLCPKLACRYLCTNGQMELTSRGSNCCLINKIPCALFVSQKIDVLCYRWDNHYLLVQLLEPRNNSPAPMSLPHFSDLLYYSYSLVLALLHT